DIPAQGSRPAFVRRVIAYEDLDNLLSDPLVFFKNGYRWGHSDFAGERLGQSIAELLESWNFNVRGQRSAGDTLDHLSTGALSPDNVLDLTPQLSFIEHSTDPEVFGAGVGFFLLPETAVDKPGFALLPFASDGFEHEIRIAEKLSLEFKGSIDLTGNIGILV